MNQRSMKRKMTKNQAESPNALVAALLRTQDGQRLINSYVQAVTLAKNLAERYTGLQERMEHLTERIQVIDTAYQNLVAFMASSRMIRIEALQQFEEKMKATMEEMERMQHEAPLEEEDDDGRKYDCSPMEVTNLYDDDDPTDIRATGNPEGEPGDESAEDFLARLRSE